MPSLDGNSRPTADTRCAGADTESLPSPVARLAAAATDASAARARSSVELAFRVLTPYDIEPRAIELSEVELCEVELPEVELCAIGPSDLEPSEIEVPDTRGPSLTTWLPARATLDETARAICGVTARAGANSDERAIGAGDLAIHPVVSLDADLAGAAHVSAPPLAPSFSIARCCSRSISPLLSVMG
jgi:hypothetical protein